MKKCTPTSPWSIPHSEKRGLMFSYPLKFRHHLAAAIIFLVSLYSSSAYSQHKQHPDGIRCGTTEQVNKYFQRNPKALSEAKAFNEHTKNKKQNANAREASVAEYVIPVVFHIFGKEFNSGSEVTDQIVKDALAKTNNDFKGLTSNQNDLDPTFSPIRRTLNVTFVLASKDPNGNATTGINYYPLNAGFGNDDGYDEEIQKYAWNNYQYMNVYIMRDLYDDEDQYNSGVAWYPDTYMSDNNLARVVYNGSYLGTNTNENFRRVLTHEFGHYLNLIHTFEGGCTQPNDEVDDTPPADKSKMGDGCRSGINCFGNKINGENFMDYSNCYKMFTNGQVNRMITALEDHNTRRPLWQIANTHATIGTVNQAKLIPSSKREFLESTQNPGTIGSTYIINLANTTWNTSPGVFTSGIHFSASNVPAGLSVKVTTLNSTSAQIELTGTANNHSKANSINNLKITFLGAAFSNGSANGLLSSTVEYKISFIEGATELGTTLQLGEGLGATATTDVIHVTPDNPWRRFYLPENAPENVTRFGDAVFGAWSTGGQARMEAYQKGMVCENSDVNQARISLLSYNTPIGPSSNWNTGGAYPNEHYFVTSNYSAWKGKTGFAGIRLTADGQTYYGWLRIGVSEDGKSVSVYDWGYSRQPNTSINAGVSPIRALGKPNNKVIEDVELNDGSVSAQLNMFLYNDTFTVTNGALTQGTHYTISGVPSGLTASINVIGSREAVLSFSGKAINHAVVNKANLSIAFQNSAFTGGNATGVRSSSFNLTINFFDPYEIRYGSSFLAYSSNNVFGIFDDLTVNSSNTWEPFNFQVKPGNNDLTKYISDEFGAWFNSGNVRFESVENDIICTDGTVSEAKIVPLTFNEEIGPTSTTWNSGGAYPNEHYITTSSYSAWKGKTAYIGISFRDMDGYLHYAWIKASVSADGSSMTLIDYAYNSGPNKPIRAGVKTSGGGDTVAPTAPSNLASSTITQSSVTLTWNASSDNVGVTGYDVLRNNSVIASTTATNYVNNGLSSNTQYTYTVRAKDAAGNISPVSNAITITTLSGSDTQAPTSPTNLVASAISQSGAQLNWTASTDNVGVTGYEIRVNNTLVATATTNSYTLSGLTAATTYSVSVTAKDAAGNVSTASSISFSTTSGSSSYCASAGGSVRDEFIDQIQLGSINNLSGANGGYGNFTSQSTNISIGSVYSITVTPSWTTTVYSEGYAAWIDYNKDGDFADANEQIWSLDASKVTPVTGTFTVPAGVLTGTTRMRVSMKYNGIPAPCEAFDYGEVEDYSVNIQAGSGDTQAPSAPSNLVASNITQTSLTLTWNASTDNVGVTGYDIFNGSTDIGDASSTTFVVNGLTASTTYSFSIKAKDAAGNLSVASNIATITTTGSSSASYCAVTNGSSGQYVTKVVFGSINNTSDFSSGGYADYTTLSTTAAKGSTISLAVTLQSLWAASRAAVWIDWNKDGDFTDAGEQVMNASGSSTSAYTASVVVPATAQTGNTRMRVRAEYGLTSINPCGNGWHSEVEDYTINVSSGATGPLENAISKAPAETSQVYPNPNEGVFTVKIPATTSKTHIRIYNFVGNLIKSIEVENQSQVDIVLDVPAGLYTLRMQSNGNHSSHSLIIK